MNTNDFPYITGITWGWCAPAEQYTSRDGEISFRKMAEKTHCNTVVIAFTALQDNPHVTEIDDSRTPSYDQLKAVTSLASEYEMRVILKPTVDCRDGIWRGHISFFDEDVPGEPTWAQWFESYGRYQLRYAEIAEKLGVDMLCVACEMVQAQKRSEEWRALIEKIRSVYGGLITFNADKYQEDRVDFWDCLDVISSSGYYPVNKWDEQLDRIEKVVKKYKKPFFFIEAGCMSTKNAPFKPNRCTIFDEQKKALMSSGMDAPSAEDTLLDFEGQADYYKVMFQKCEQRAWMRGFGLWDWPTVLPYDETSADYRKNYSYIFYMKPAEKVITDYFDVKNQSQEL